MVASAPKIFCLIWADVFDYREEERAKRVTRASRRKRYAAKEEKRHAIVDHGTCSGRKDAWCTLGEGKCCPCNVTTITGAMGGDGSGGAQPNTGRKPDIHRGKKQSRLNFRGGGLVVADAAPKRTATTTAAEANKRRRKEKEDAARKAAIEAQKRQERVTRRNAERETARLALEALQAATAMVGLATGNNRMEGDDDEEDYVGDEEEDEDYDVDAEDSNPEADDVVEEVEKEKREKASKESSRYKPPTDSKLGQYLTKKRRDIFNLQEKGVTQAWFPPETTAIYESGMDPFSYCKDTAWVYNFNPFQCHNSLIGEAPSSYQCIHCDRVGYLESNGYYWRPQHFFAETIWLNHRRLVCRRVKGGCGRTFAEFHPKFMGQLPNVVVEQFPFLPTASGIGIHKSMMHQFLYLCTKGILFGTYCNAINEMKMTKYWSTHCTYLDRLHDKAKGFGDFFVPMPFYPFQSVGEYNGILLKPSLMRKLFLQVMNTFEKYLQESFQLCSDESESSDHTFKFAKMISCFRAGKVFLASYDSISLAGLCTFNRLCHTKSNDEIRPLIQQLREVRLNAGVPLLKRVEGDGGGDRSLWPAVFTELKEKVKPYQPPTQNGLPRAEVKEEHFSVYNSKEAVNNLALSLADAVAGLETETHFGLDTECNLDETRAFTRVISICLPSSVHDQVIVMDLTSMGCYSKDDFPSAMKALLENPKLIPVAVNISFDAPRLKDLGVSFVKRIELMELGKQLEPNHGRAYGMKAMVGRILGMYVDKSCQIADWREMSSRNDLKHYAALDAYLHLRLYHEITRRLSLGEGSGNVSQFTAGQKVKLMYRNRCCALGKLQFVGGRGGENRSWGSLTIGRGKSLVEIEKVTMNSVRPVFSFKATPEDNKPGWDHSKTYLRDVFQLHKTPSGSALIAWPTNRVQVQLESIAEHAVTLGETNAPPRLPDAPPREEEQEESQEDNVDEMSSYLRELDDLLADVDDGDLPRSREYGDRFHVFDSMPKSKDPTTKNCLALARRMIIQGTTEFDLDDWTAVTRYLSDSLDITSIEDVLDHFHFNRKWWYRRVRVYPPTAEKGARNIAAIREMIENTDAFKSAWPKLEKYLDDLEQMCQEGKLAECYDVSLYQWDGRDSHGLDVWLRRRGSNRSENMHQKMRVAFGPHGVGAEVGHFLLLLVTYRYNVNSGIRRKGNHNFGMPYHFLIDRIQIRMVQLFGHEIFPQHTNQTLFQPIEGFVAVGVGPLNYDERYVEEGEPHENLSGDMRFLAKRMKLVGPPLHISTYEERRIFNSFMRNHPKPNSKTWLDMAALFKGKADYKTVFPKLPSMLRAHYTKWKVTQELKMIKASIHEKYYTLLKDLGIPTEAAADSNPAGAFQKESSQPPDEVDDAFENSPNDFGCAEENTHNVAPMGTTGQVRYNPSASGRSRKGKSCAGGPFGCPNLAANCAGMNGDWTMCHLIIAKDSRIKVYPTSAAHAKELTKIHNQKKKNKKRNAARAAERAAEQAERAAALEGGDVLHAEVAAATRAEPEGIATEQRWWVDGPSLRKIFGRS